MLARRERASDAAHNIRSSRSDNSSGEKRKRPREQAMSEEAEKRRPRGETVPVSTSAPSTRGGARTATTTATDRSKSTNTNTHTGTHTHTRKDDRSRPNKHFQSKEKHAKPTNNSNSNKSNHNNNSINSKNNRSKSRWREKGRAPVVNAEVNALIEEGLRAQREKAARESAVSNTTITAGNADVDNVLVSEKDDHLERKRREVLSLYLRTESDCFLPNYAVSPSMEPSQPLPLGKSLSSSSPPLSPLSPLSAPFPFISLPIDRCEARSLAARMLGGNLVQGLLRSATRTHTRSAVHGHWEMLRNHWRFFSPSRSLTYCAQDVCDVQLHTKWGFFLRGKDSVRFMKDKPSQRIQVGTDGEIYRPREAAQFLMSGRFFQDAAWMRSEAEACAVALMSYQNHPNASSREGDRQDVLLLQPQFSFEGNGGRGVRGGFVVSLFSSKSRPSIEFLSAESANSVLLCSERHIHRISLTPQEVTPVWYSPPAPAPTAATRGLSSSHPTAISLTCAEPSTLSQLSSGENVLFLGSRNGLVARIDTRERQRESEIIGKMDFCVSSLQCLSQSSLAQLCVQDVSRSVRLFDLRSTRTCVRDIAKGDARHISPRNTRFWLSGDESLLALPFPHTRTDNNAQTQTQTQHVASVSLYNTRSEDAFLGVSPLLPASSSNAFTTCRSVQCAGVAGERSTTEELPFLTLCRGENENGAILNYLCEI